MKITTLLVLMLTVLTNCTGQSKYFQAKGIIDRTKEYSEKKKWCFLNDKEQADGYTRIGDSIFGGEIACDIKPLKNIDAKSFQVLAGTGFAKDKNHVYYPINTSCIDYSDCGVCFFERILVENASPQSFQYLGKDYATDGKLVFFRGQLLQGADGLTFKVIDGPQYFYFATDKQNVYKHGQIFKDADPATFYYDKKDPRNIDQQFGPNYIIGDKSKKWQYVPPDSIKEVPKL